ncbi:539_t:CDS:2, partial [Entrophospora sp. SA101]
IDCLHVVNIDDFHDIHEKRRPDATSLSTVKHFASCVSKKVESSLECIVDRKCLPTGYHTTCTPLSGICDHCRQALSNSTNEVNILICGHGYHNRCYNLLDKTCKWCKE